MALNNFNVLGHVKSPFWDFLQIHQLFTFWKKGDGRGLRDLPFPRVGAIIGRFHLRGAKPEVTVKAVAGIKAFRPDYIVPIHRAEHEAILACARVVLK